MKKATVSLAQWMETCYERNEARRLARTFYMSWKYALRAYDDLYGDRCETERLIDKLKSDLAEAESEIVILKQRDERTETLVSLGIGALNDDLRDAWKRIAQLEAANIRLRKVMLVYYNSRWQFFNLLRRARFAAAAWKRAAKWNRWRRSNSYQLWRNMQKRGYISEAERRSKAAHKFRHDLDELPY